MMLHAGYLFEASGYATQGFHIYLAQGLRLGEADREPSEQDLVSRAFRIDEVLAMVLDGTIKDAATVAALGLLRLKGYF